ncbi:hypothetical protein E8E12_009906 [Didymella heteroderae]|uniref:Uncharacterized protein n=1 Tax=Didymella heteroderae TaxID=1769908 RepID=A0A9P4WVA6_9PLEO|nr:hypothetical protein E8E12_009906 [Didymella heteroderae]
MSPVQLGMTFGDFPGVPAEQVDTSSTIAQRSTPAMWFDAVEWSTREHLVRFSDAFEDDASPLTYDSGQGSSLETPTNVHDTVEEERQMRSQSDDLNQKGTDPKVNGAVMRAGCKRRRRSSSVSLSNGALPCPAISFAAEFMSSANKSYLREGLLKIYHDSFENALSCWLTETTCPYTLKADISSANEGGPDWNRMYHRVFRLDRLASSIGGRQLTFQEDKAVSKALNSAIFSFATQWAQKSERSRAKYPYGHGGNAGVFTGQRPDTSWNDVEFDRTMQIAAWNEARKALQDAGDIESFRLVLAQIVFSLTQRPHNSQSGAEKTPEAADIERAAANGGDVAVEECEDLMSKLNLAIDAEDPPIHLEKGVRLIHSLRSRMTVCANTPPLKSRPTRRGKQHKPSANRVDAADRATIDLLFWLGVVFDTLSSAMHKRPLVVSDEDSNVYATESRAAADQTQLDIGSVMSRSTEGVWDFHLFAHQRNRLQQTL